MCSAAVLYQRHRSSPSSPSSNSGTESNFQYIHIFHLFHISGFYISPLFPLYDQDPTSPFPGYFMAFTLGDTTTKIRPAKCSSPFSPQTTPNSITAENQQSCPRRPCKKQTQNSGILTAKAAIHLLVRHTVVSARCAYRRCGCKSESTSTLVRRDRDRSRRASSLRRHRGDTKPFVYMHIESI